MASVKWVARIAARTAPFDGWFQHDRYVYERDGRREPVDVMRVKSMLVAPEANHAVARGPVLVWGWAWSGASPIARVEISLDGEAWHPAALDDPLAPHAWRRFQLTVDIATPGRHTLRTRAYDSCGGVQPDVSPWNEHGYGNNAVTPVSFYVV
jgi:hypothetical protein